MSNTTVPTATEPLDLAQFSNYDLANNQIETAVTLLAEVKRQRATIAMLRGALENMTRTFSDLPASRNYGLLVQNARAALAKAQQ